MRKKLPSSVIGLDLGRHSIKTVALQRKGGNRFVVSNYGVHVMSGAPLTPDQLTYELKQALREVGASAKSCAVAVSSTDSLIRIIEQPETPREILRDAIRLNGLSLLNQEVKEFVLDCEPISQSPNGKAPKPEKKKKGEGPAAAPVVQPVKYLVAGLPRSRVQFIDQAFQQYKRTAIHNIQLASVCNFNAFEFSNPETFANEAFLLVDIGHHNSTVTVGVKKELVIVRAIDYGASHLREFLISNGAPKDKTFELLEAGDELALDNARLSLAALTREIASSIGFFEGRREENITRVYVSGGGARHKSVLTLLSEELHIPCEAWDPFTNCEVALPAGRKESLAADFVSLNVACGAAAEALRK
ncbi:MAG TPA: pilus assembly protein PilM [Chthoniobacteraceae bacterium]|jgi:type IV pilus assembly protein PilM|nr:pilus assembly protein PilM [Chthoniobacteraceae bacterium]